MDRHLFLQDERMFTSVVTRLRAAGCVFAEEEAQWLVEEAKSTSHLNAMVEQRVAGFPLEQVIGWAEFCGHRIVVEPGVFVPRRRTELLVQEAAKLTLEGDTVVDLCCGTGAVGAVLAAIHKGITLYGADLDPVAVHCALRNLQKVGGRVFEGNLFEPLPPELLDRINLLAVNAPYVPTHAIERLPKEAQLYEARLALDGGIDGLDIQRLVAAAAPLWLAPGGYVLVETSEQQMELTVQILKDNGLQTSVARCEQLEATVVIGRK